MISGKINIHTEPTKYTPPTYPLTPYRQGISKYSPKEKEEVLKQELDAATIMGVTIGTRVKRANGYSGYGTVTCVYDFVTTAFSTSTGECEPFKVVWDGPSGQGLGYGFCYCLADLVPVAPD